MAVENNPIWRNVDLVHDVRKRRFAVEIKTRFIGGRSPTHTITTIIKQQYIEASFSKTLRQPTHVGDIPAVPVEIDDGTGVRPFLLFEVPTV